MEKRQVKRIGIVPIVARTYLSHKSHVDTADDPKRVRVLDLQVQVVVYGEPFQVRYSLLVLECYGTSIGGGQASLF